MRIRFRVWDAENRTMTYPNDKPDPGSDVAGGRYALDLQGWVRVGVWFWSAFEVDTHNANGNAVTLLSTGQHDKNGREIYEGDIVEGVFIGEPFRLTVEWNATETGFDPFRTAHESLMCDESAENVVVVGNIYEYPERVNVPTTATVP